MESMITIATILQIDATIITGILILLTLTKNTLTRQMTTEKGLPYTHKTMRLPINISSVVIPFSFSALTILLPLVIHNELFMIFGYHLSLIMMMIGFLHIIGIILYLSNQKLI